MLAGAIFVSACFTHVASVEDRCAPDDDGFIQLTSDNIKDIPMLSTPLLVLMSEDESEPSSLMKEELLAAADSLRSKTSFAIAECSLPRSGPMRRRLIRQLFKEDSKVSLPQMRVLIANDNKTIRSYDFTPASPGGRVGIVRRAVRFRENRGPMPGVPTYRLSSKKMDAFFRRHHLGLVLFSSSNEDTCGARCVLAADEFTALATEDPIGSRTVKLGSVDLATYPSLGRRYGIDQSPKVILFRDGAPKVYRGQIQAEALLQWIGEEAAPAAVLASNVEELSSLIDVRDASRPTIVGTFQGARSEAFDKAAAVFRSEYCFVVTNPEVAELAGLPKLASSASGVSMVHGPQHIVTDGEDRLRDVRQMYLQSSSTDLGDLVPFIERHRLPAVAHIDPGMISWLGGATLLVLLRGSALGEADYLNRCRSSTQQGLTDDPNCGGGSGCGKVCEGSSCGTELSKRWQKRHRYHASLQHLRSTLPANTELQFAVGDHNDLSPTLPAFGLQDAPGSVHVALSTCGLANLSPTYSTSGCRKFVLQGDASVTEAIERFVHGYISGQLDAYVRSAAPPDASKTSTRTPTLVVGTTFHAEVSAKLDLDVVLFVHDGRCAKVRKCRKVKEDMGNLAKEVYELELTRTRVVTVDISLNEIPATFQVDGKLPRDGTIFFLPAHRVDNDAAQLYDGDTSVDKLILFLRANGHERDQIAATYT